eukprot:UN2164
MAAGKCMPEWNEKSILGKHKLMSLLLRSLNPFFEKTTEEEPYGGGLSFWGGLPGWHKVELQFAEEKKVIPRMFLYSTQDNLIRQEAVEVSIDTMWELFRGMKVPILVERCKKALHMKLWLDGAECLREGRCQVPEGRQAQEGLSFPT